MDAKSLLRAKKASTKVEHPYAVYNASNQLRCSICAVPVQQWDAHLLTKQHRTSVAREKALQAKQKEKAAKRPAEEASLPQSKKVKPNGVGSTLPAGFFSAGNPMPIVDDDDDDEEEEDKTPIAGPSRLPPTPAVPPPTAEPPKPTGDAELDDFLSSLATDTDNDPLPSIIAPLQPRRTGYTTSSSAALSAQASYEAAPVRNVPAEETKVEEVEPEESEKDRRERLAREEREEIMGRLEEEERAQEDADSRVAMLKARMETLKKKREAAKANGKSKPPQTGEPPEKTG